MRICMVEDDFFMTRALTRYLGTVCGLNVEAHRSYENLVPNDGIDIYFLDHDNDFGINGSRWIEFYGKNVPVHERLLTSSNISNWDDTTGVKIVKPYNMIDLENTLNLMYENNKRFKK